MPRSKFAVKVPIAAPRRSGTTRLTASSESEGNSSEKAAPIAIAPTITTGNVSAAPISNSPSDSTRAAPNAQRAAPMRSGRCPPTSRVATTVPAKTLKTSGPWPIPR